MDLTIVNQRALSDQQIADATERYGTPLYAYNFDVIDRQCVELREHLPKNYHIHYALKANSNLTVCHYLSQQCRGADVSSLGELQTAVKAGFTPNQIIFTGPAKDRQELTAALEVGCGLIVLESLTEAQRLQQIAQEQGKTQDVLLRINPWYRTDNSCDVQHLKGQNGASTTDLKTFICNQGASKFGVDEEKAEEVIDAILALSHLQFKGIHIFTESNVLKYEELLASWENTIHIANTLRAKGYPITVVDFGGGIGIPYNRVDVPFDMAAFGQHLQKICDNTPYEYEYIVEMGRYVVGESGIYITEVLDIKQSQGEKFVLINGGIHQLCRPQFLAEMNKNMAVVGKSDDTKEKEKTKVVGKLPTSSDALIKEIVMTTDVAIGDKIAIHTTGAYGFNFGLANFILHSYPAEVAYIHGVPSLIRKRGKVTDFFINQTIPNTQNTNSL